MKCYKCKKQINISVRKLIGDKFRDVCKRCYKEIMANDGYILKNGIWRLK